MRKLLALFALCCLIAACATKTKVTNDQSITTTANDTSATVVRDGSSFKNAIVINEKSEGPGVDAEYAWLRKNYPGYKMKRQSLTYNDKKPYDILSIETAEGKDKNIYFDISKFFGKF